MNAHAVTTKPNKACMPLKLLPGSPRDNEMAWFLLGAIYERQKLFERLKSEFKKGIDGESQQRIGAELLWLHARRSRTSALTKRESLVQRALKEDPYNGAYLDSLGWIYFKQNKLGEAEATLRKALERDRTIRPCTRTSAMC